MKVTAFNGSPAGRNSATNVMIEAFLRGAGRAGAETENIQLTEYRIGQCQGCFACWFRTPGSCVLKDDMGALLQKYSQADVVCFGTPVYTWNMTALLKNFVDRLVPLKSPRIVEKQGAFDLADARPKTQKFVVLSNCGFPGERNFEVMKAAVASCGPTLEIYRSCGKLLKSRDEAVRPVVERYLAAVEQAGFEMASALEVCPETRQLLDMQLMSVADYVAYIGM